LQAIVGGSPFSLHQYSTFCTKRSVSKGIISNRNFTKMHKLYYFYDYYIDNRKFTNYY